MIEDPQLRQLFEAESAEHLGRLDDGLLRLEKTPADRELLEEAFREAHSLKGAARMLGLSKIEIAAHDLESILNTARKGEAQLTPDVIEGMTVALGGLRKLVREALGGMPAGAAEAGAEAQPSPSGKAAMSPVEDGAARDAVPATLPQEASAPAASPVSAAAERQRAQLVQPFRIETVRMETRKLDDLLTLAGELSVIQGRTQHRLALMEELAEQWTVLERSRRKLRSLARRMAATDRMDEALRQMLQADGEALTRLGDGIKRMHDALYEDGARLESVANTLEERVHAARLLPLSTVFSLFPRMVRDLAREQGKELELAIEGGELNVDKRILEEMKDPLMHLLRNAIDHGIEAPAERERLGKPRSGALLLRAQRKNNYVLLEVRDDGRGLDADAIRRTALRHGLYDEAALAAMSTAQLQQMIFLPGFSTSTFVTELSGRGVGLDVVRVNLERLKGDIRLESVPHGGTSMQLRLPLGLATTRLLLVDAAGRRYGLPVEFVHTSRRVRDEDIFTLEGRPAFEFDGQAVIAPHLSDLLELPAAPPAQREMSGAAVYIVIRIGDERLGLRVDELLDEEEVLVKPLGVPLRRVRNVSGLTILGNGDICAVLNPADLLRAAHKLAARSAVDRPERAQAVVKSCILLAEDTMLVRVMEKRILEDAGYEVVAVVDGMAALDALSTRSFAAVVSDVMMPNMDGLTLTARIREEPRYRDLPVVLVTSLASDEDKRRGLEVGANAYIPKPSFDQSVLLDTLQRLIVR